VSRIKSMMVLMFFIFFIFVSFCFFFGGLNTVAKTNERGETLISAFLTIPGMVTVSLPADSVDLLEGVIYLELDLAFPKESLESLEFILGTYLKKEGSCPGYELKWSGSRWILKAPPRTIRFFGPKRMKKITPWLKLRPEPGIHKEGEMAV